MGWAKYSLSYECLTIRWLILLLLLPVAGAAQLVTPHPLAQKDLIDIGKKLFVFKPRPRSVNNRGIYFSFLPASTQAAGPSGLSVTATTAAFSLGEPRSTYLSTVTFAPYVATQGRLGFAFRSNLWLSDNSWDILGDTRMLYYPQDTWGLGGRSEGSQRLSLNYKYVRFYQTFLRRIKPYFFAGMGILIDAHYDMESHGDSLLLRNFTLYPYGTAGSETSLSTGFSMNLLYDARKNTENPMPGYYANFVFRENPPIPGNTIPWRSIYLDTRKYIPFSRQGQNMLALWAFYWSVLESHAPYLELPSIGWDPYQQRSGRGFPQNRYRGSSILYAEAEYRRDITGNGLLGFVIFANVNSVTQPWTEQLSYVHPAGGVGLRIKFNKKSGTNIAIDYGMSEHYRGFCLNLGETF
jgi:outer membrane protein assembly factor BamA